MNKTVTLYYADPKLDLAPYQAIAEGNGNKFNSKNVTEEGLTEVQLFTLSDKIGVSIHELVSKDKKEDLSLDKAETAKFLSTKPSHLKLPIVEIDDKAIFVSKSRDLLKIMETDGNGINENDHLNSRKEA